MKRSGQRWSKRSVDAMLKLRTRYESGRWEQVQKLVLNLNCKPLKSPTKATVCNAPLCTGRIIIHISTASAFRFVRYKNSKKVITWDALKVRVSQHRWGSLTAVGRVDDSWIDSRPHRFAVTQDSNRNSG